MLEAAEIGPTAYAAILRNSPQPPESNDDEADLQGCEHCGKSFPFEQCHRMDDCWICDACYSEWKKVFDACEHDWEPHVNEYGEDGRYCKKCAGVVVDETEAVSTAPAPTEQAYTLVDEWLKRFGGDSEARIDIGIIAKLDLIRSVSSLIKQDRFAAPAPAVEGVVAYRYRAERWHKNSTGKSRRASRPRYRALVGLPRLLVVQMEQLERWS
jgi:hypothetical protein